MQFQILGFLATSNPPTVASRELNVAKSLVTNVESIEWLARFAHSCEVQDSIPATTEIGQGEPARLKFVE